MSICQICNTSAEYIQPIEWKLCDNQDCMFTFDIKRRAWWFNYIIDNVRYIISNINMSLVSINFPVSLTSYDDSPPNSKHDAEILVKRLLKLKSFL